MWWLTWRSDLGGRNISSALSEAHLQLTYAGFGSFRASIYQSILNQNIRRQVKVRHKVPETYSITGQRQQQGLHLLLSGRSSSPGG